MCTAHVASGTAVKPECKTSLSFVSPFPAIQRQPLIRQRQWRPRMQTESSDDLANKSAESTTSSDSSSLSACPGCGRHNGVMSGCDGDGRIQGGLGAVVKWWPIKAYRPCPEYLKAKKTYRRAGQSLEEIAFGRKGVDDDLSISERLQGK